MAEFYELGDDDASHKDMYSVWKQVPEIAVGEKVQYDEINSKRKIELQPAKSPGRRQSKGRNKAPNGITAKSDATQKPRRNNGRIIRPPQPELIRDQLKECEFHVAAVINHWPQEMTWPHAR